MALLTFSSENVVLYNVYFPYLFQFFLQAAGGDVVIGDLHILALTPVPVFIPIQCEVQAREVRERSAGYGLQITATYTTIHLSILKIQLNILKSIKLISPSLNVTQPF